MADSPLRRASVPLEFTVAAFRIAHSAIRACYTINPEARNVPLFPDPADGPPADDAPTSLIGQRPLHDTHIVTWEHMLRVPGSQSRVQYARRFGPRLPAFLKHMRELKDEGGLAGRDLERGRVLGLPSGQAVARRLGIPLPPELQIGNDPLWYYVMKEVPEGGSSVGPVAARILSKVFLDVLHLDPDSYLCCEPRWRPNGVSDPANSLLQLVRVAGMPFGPPDDGG
jgi:hypothetical protein